MPKYPIDILFLDTENETRANMNINQIAFNDMNITTIDKSDFGLTNLFEDYTEPSVR